jgi:hypothetical protein
VNITDGGSGYTYSPSAFLTENVNLPYKGVDTFFVGGQVLELLIGTKGKNPNYDYTAATNKWVKKAPSRMYAIPYYGACFGGIDSSIAISNATNHCVPDPTHKWMSSKYQGEYAQGVHVLSAWINRQITHEECLIIDANLHKLLLPGYS